MHFDCVVGEEWPDLYHGVLEVAIEVPRIHGLGLGYGGQRGFGGGNRGGAGHGCGSLRFPDLNSVGVDLADVYLLCQYETRDAVAEYGGRSGRARRMV